MSKVAIIGSGFSGLSAAAYLSRAGYQVDVFEKNSSLGGRARQFTTDNGYVFDMGPSWYWMPDVFERFFSDFGYSVADFYQLVLLNPSFEIVFGLEDKLSVPENFEQLCDLFESLEVGAGAKLVQFMQEAAFKYKVGMENLVYKPCHSLTEFMQFDTLKGIFSAQIFASFSKHVRSYFKHPKLVALMEFPVLFLGAMPEETPALYSLMNYAGLKLGTWYPMGGFVKIVEAMVSIAERNGATFHTNATVESIEVEGKQTSGIAVNGKFEAYDVVIAAADYQHVESKLLASPYRNYSESYWKKRVFAPSSLIYYIGVNKRIEHLEHHTLFFDEALHQHSVEIYKEPQWPSKPLFYVCCPSKTDDSVAPSGHENLFFLMPLAVGIEDSEALREKYFQIMLKRFEKYLGQEVSMHIDYKRSFCVRDFVSEYNSYKGNAYGLANTLRQTAILKPKIVNRKLSNLFYCGQLTVPGPGVPPSLISGKIVSEAIQEQFKIKANEVHI